MIQNNKDQSVKKRNRRTKIEIEKSLFEAATRIVIKSGFTSLTATNLIAEADVDPPVFYNRYEDINDFLEIYVRNYDYWLRDTIDISANNTNHIENINIIFNELIDSLLINEPMQKLIAWELNNENYITKRTSQGRDLTLLHITNHLKDTFKEYTIKCDYTFALLIGGIYYLIIHRELGTLFQIDFTKKESIDNLKMNLKSIICKLFEDHDNWNSKTHIMIDVAKELVKNNIEYKLIKKATKLSDSILKSLYPK